MATAFLQGLPQEWQLWVKLPADAPHILGTDSECRVLLKKPCFFFVPMPCALEALTVINPLFRLLLSKGETLT